MPAATPAVVAQLEPQDPEVAILDEAEIQELAFIITRICDKVSLSWILERDAALLLVVIDVIIGAPSSGRIMKLGATMSPVPISHWLLP